MLLNQIVDLIHVFLIYLLGILFSLLQLLISVSFDSLQQCLLLLDMKLLNLLHFFVNCDLDTYRMVISFSLIEFFTFEFELLSKDVLFN